MWHWDFSLT